MIGLSLSQVCETDQSVTTKSTDWILYKILVLSILMRFDYLFVIDWLICWHKVVYLSWCSSDIMRSRSYARWSVIQYQSKLLQVRSDETTLQIVHTQQLWKKDPSEISSMHRAHLKKLTTRSTCGSKANYRYLYLLIANAKNSSSIFWNSRCTLLVRCIIYFGCYDSKSYQTGKLSSMSSYLQQMKSDRKRIKMNASKIWRKDG